MQSTKYYQIKHWPEMYLDWVNNFITTAKFAEYYGINLTLASDIIDTGRATDNFTKPFDWSLILKGEMNHEV